MKAPLRTGLSDFLRNSLISFAGALPVSDSIMAVFPTKTVDKSSKSLSEASMALANSVFFTTSNLMFALKQARLKLEVVSAFNPETSVK